MDFEQLRKDMEADTRRIARVPDLERIALAAEKYRKAVLKARSEAEIGGWTSVYAFHARVKAREELFALLTSKDAT